jgi:hypothetical protein
MEMAVKICLAVERRFALDLIVRKPKDLEWRLAEGDWFLREIVSKGKVLHEAPHSGMGATSRKRFPVGHSARPRKPPSTR